MSLSLGLGIWKCLYDNKQAQKQACNKASKQRSVYSIHRTAYRVLRPRSASNALRTSHYVLRILQYVLYMSQCELRTWGFHKPLKLRESLKNGHKDVSKAFIKHEAKLLLKFS